MHIDSELTLISFLIYRTAHSGRKRRSVQRWLARQFEHELFGFEQRNLHIKHNQGKTHKIRSLRIELGTRNVAGLPARPR